MQFTIKRTLNKMSSKKILFISIVLLLILTCLPISLCLPGIIRKTLQALSVGLFVVGLLIQRDRIYILEYAVCAIFSFIYVYNVWGFTQSFSTCLFNVLAGLSFCFYGIYSIEMKEENREYTSKVLNFLLVLFVLTAITTIIGLEKYPLAVRELGRSNSGYTTSGDAFLALKFKYRMNNIASWSMIYGMVFLPSGLLMLYKKEKKARYLMFLLICELCIFKAQLTIGLILSLLGIVLTLYKPSRKAKDLFILITVIFGSLILFLFVVDILEFVISIIDKGNLSTLSNKLTGLLNLLRGTTSGDASARFERYERSLKIFMDNPVLGISIHGIKEEGIFGNHSDIFDILGYYGFFGILVMIGMGIRYFYYMAKNIKIGYWNIIAMFFVFIFLAILNPVWYSPQVFVCAMMLPMLAMYAEKGYVKNRYKWTRL